MPVPDDQNLPGDAWRAMARTALRVAFGIIWVVNAAFTWTGDFANHYVGYLHNASQGQPAWSAFWFNAWIAIVTPHATLFIWLTRIIETVLAAALILGIARKSLYFAGALFSLLVWSTAEGFGGPYAVGAANMGAGIVYVLVFVALIAINSHAGPSPYSVDFYLEKRWPWWRRVADSGNVRQRGSVSRVSAGVQGTALAGIAILVVLLVLGLQSSLHVQAPSPAAAAAAVTPLSLASNKPISQAYDARLPPLTPGPSVNVHLTVTDDRIEIASGVYYAAWTYDGTVPGPIIHVLQGQTVNVTLTNHGTMDHSIDFHAAQVAPNEDFVDIAPGKSLHFSFVADVPGAFIYHCETMPILLHVGNGMYGALIVSPKDPLPPATESYVLVQSEWYTQQLAGNLMGPDYQAMLKDQPDEVVFNGAAFQYVAHPLIAHPGQRVRIYFVDAGPDLHTSFHVIGAIFRKVYPSGDMANALSEVSAYSLGPGQGAIFDLDMPKPGKYSFVDHNLSNIMIGAHGIIDVTASGEPESAHIPAGVVTAGGSVAPTLHATITSGPVAAVAPATPAGSFHFDPARGAALYATNCAACHQATGLGMPGAFPPLKGNPVVLNPDPAQQIGTILHGLHGQNVMGTVYPGAMPAFGASLSDTQIANIVDHERSSWGNDGKLVTAKTVQKLRAEAGKAAT